MLGLRFERSCCTTPSAMGFWSAAFVSVYGAGLLLQVAWPTSRAYVDTLILAALGAACFINFRRHRTLHCGLTAPIFLLAAIAAGLEEAGVWKFDVLYLWAVVLVCVGIAFVVEWRTFAQPRGTRQR